MTLTVSPASIQNVVSLGHLLMTPERLAGDEREVFRVVPEWASRFMAFPEGHVGFILDGACRLGVFMPALEFAVLEELTRFGGAVEVVRLPRVDTSPELVAAITFPTPVPDPMPIRCVLSGAVDDGRSKPSWVVSDYSAANPAYQANPRAAAMARSIVVNHARTLAVVHARSHSAAVDWRANLETLFGALDATRHQAAQRS